MLVLTRRVDEEIVVGSGEQAVVVKVIRVKGQSVRIGIEAPKSVRVLRSEMCENPPELQLEDVPHITKIARAYQEGLAAGKRFAARMAAAQS